MWVIISVHSCSGIWDVLINSPWSGITLCPFTHKCDTRLRRYNPLIYEARTWISICIPSDCQLRSPGETIDWFYIAGHGCFTQNSTYAELLHSLLNENNSRLFNLEEGIRWDNQIRWDGIILNLGPFYYCGVWTSISTWISSHMPGYEYTSMGNFIPYYNQWYYFSMVGLKLIRISKIPLLFLSGHALIITLYWTQQMQLSRNDCGVCFDGLISTCVRLSQISYNLRRPTFLSITFCWTHT